MVFLAWTWTEKMAKIQKLRFVTEVAPPKFISVIKRPLTKILDTINEEETMYLVFHHPMIDIEIEHDVMKVPSLHRGLKSE